MVAGTGIMCLTRELVDFDTDRRNNLKLARNEKLLTLPWECLRHIFRGLMEKDVLSLSAASQKLKELCNRDEIWFYLSERRWKVRCIKRRQSSSLRCNGIDVWVKILHGTGCRPHMIEHRGSVVKSFHLKVIFQNVHNNCSFIDLSKIRVLNKTKYREDELVFPHANEKTLEEARQLFIPTLIAYNGEKINSLPCHSIALKPFDYAVVNVTVGATGCEFETDFIARSHCIEASVVNVLNTSNRSMESMVLCPFINKTHILSAAARREFVTVRAFFIDEMIIPEYYQQFPGGCVVLKDRG